MTQPKHIHLIGICGTAMASLAGMLKERGFRVTGSDAASYPPMSTFLESLGISVAQPFAETNLDPKPDLVVVGNALSRGNVELERVLDERIPVRSLPQICMTSFWLAKMFWWLLEHTVRQQRLRCLRGSSRRLDCSLRF